MMKDAEKRGRRADEEQVFPRDHRVHARERHRARAGGDVAHGGERLEEAERLGPRVVGQRIRDERDGQTEDTADAEAGDRPENHELRDVLRKGREPRAQRVNEDGERERLGATDPIADRAEDQAAQRPARDEDALRPAAELLQHERIGAGRGEGLDGVVPRQNEELLVKAVEEPRKRGDGKDEPVVARQRAIPREGCDSREMT
jgi:hypothetical protein